MSALPTQVYVRKMKNVSTNQEDILVSANKDIGKMIGETVKVCMCVLIITSCVKENKFCGICYRRMYCIRVYYCAYRYQ